jgi:nitrile hydratase
MNGAQDMGGQMGFGPVAPEPNEPVFHAEWEKRALAVTLAMGAAGGWNIDMSRHARETLHPADYLARSYYDIWLAGLEKLMAERDLVSAVELAEGRSAGRRVEPKKILSAAEVPATLARGGPTAREASAPARFGIGDRVRTKVMHPTGHTRLPRYARGKLGVIELVHGAHVFPDTNAHGLGEQPAWLYTVRFNGRELWGEGGDPALEVCIDAFEPYLEPA